MPGIKLAAESWKLAMPPVCDEQNYRLAKIKEIAKTYLRPCEFPVILTDLHMAASRFLTDAAPDSETEKEKKEKR